MPSVAPSEPAGALSKLHPLPPAIPYTSDLALRLSRADHALGCVNGLVGYVPNPWLFLDTFMAIEAAASTRIEGTQTSTDDAFQAELAPRDHLSPDWREVANYRAAMTAGVKALETLPLSCRVLRQMHGVLLGGVRGQGRAPGEFRRVQVHIGAPGGPLEEAAYIPPPPQEVPGLMADWERFANAEAAMPLLVQCAVLHVQFEMIHPFVDGNGRLGRLLMSLFLIARGHLSQPALFLSSFFEQRRAQYYSRLLAVSQSGDWAGWVGFFLDAVRVQSAHIETSARQLLGLRDQVRGELLAIGASGTAMRLLDLLFRNPYTSVARAAEGLAVSRPTASSALRQLERVGFVEETSGKQRGRVFRAGRLLTVVRRAEAPPDDEPPDQPTLGLD